MLAVAWVVAACTGPRLPESPPSPSTSLVPDTASLVASINGGDRECDLSVTLESGDTIELGGPGFSAPWCEDRVATPLLFGYWADVVDNTTLAGTGTVGPADLLVVSGLNGDQRWVGLAAWETIYGKRSCYVIWLASGREATAAWLEGDAVHLDTGPVLPLADGYLVESVWEEPWPLRSPDYLCLDAEGRVTHAVTAMPGS
jgi:hypothetical protein